MNELHLSKKVLPRGDHDSISWLISKTLSPWEFLAILYLFIKLKQKPKNKNKTFASRFRQAWATAARWTGWTPTARSSDCGSAWLRTRRCRRSALWCCDPACASTAHEAGKGTRRERGWKGPRRGEATWGQRWRRKETARDLLSASLLVTQPVMPYIRRRVTPLQRV